MISVAYPGISPKFEIVIKYWILYTVFSNSFLFFSILSVSLGFCNFTGFVVSIPSFIIDMFWIFSFNAKSKYFSYNCSMSWSSSPSVHLLGVESWSSTGFPLESLSSAISALFIIILFCGTFSFTFNSISTSLY